MLRVSAALLLLSAAPAVQAHDLALYPIEDGERVRLDMYYGDPGKYKLIDKMKFVTLTSQDQNGQKIQFVRDVEPVANDPRKLVTGPLRLGDFSGGTYVLSAVYDNGFYVNDLENHTVATTLDWKSDVLDSGHYIKFAKALFFVDRPTAGYDRVVGHRIEFVPQADPYALKDGDRLPVKLLVDGKPMPDYKVEVGDDTAASKIPGIRTDAQGIFRVPLDHKGFYRLAADYRAKSAYPKLFEWDNYTTSLVFRR